MKRLRRLLISLMITVVFFAPIENVNNPIEKENKEIKEMLMKLLEQKK